MMAIILILTLGLSHASYPEWWEAGLGVVDKHEFYIPNQEIVKPKDSWQVLFAVTYADRNLHKLKDCVIYRVPGLQPGALKIKSVKISDDCHKEILTPGDREIQNVSKLKYQFKISGFSVEFDLPKYKSEKWEVEYANTFIPMKPELLMSSAEAKAPKVIFLAPVKVLKESHSNAPSLEDHKICHPISDDCEEGSPSICTQCTNGWYEIPNGCQEGPKYCGVDRCGEKNQPACRRGVRYQRVRKKYDCREDHSFAYCAKGLDVQCEGSLAYCR